eukprot:TRINITY_DN4205_c0_g1_i4.p4 TRINITY_DN4205_c0_g1~~TRINITY_DN4205_c0_g1_i4.p4  ORF type:complete len:186 (-),score=3.85 TRINITY_DN4205_c0_g1_i4:144-701(-)
MGVSNGGRYAPPGTDRVTRRRARRIPSGGGCAAATQRPADRPCARVGGGAAQDRQSDKEAGGRSGRGGATTMGGGEPPAGGLTDTRGERRVRAGEVGPQGSTHNDHRRRWRGRRVGVRGGAWRRHPSAPPCRSQGRAGGGAIVGGAPESASRDRSPEGGRPWPTAAGVKGRGVGWVCATSRPGNG